MCEGDQGSAFGPTVPIRYPSVVTYPRAGSQNHSLALLS